MKTVADIFRSSGDVSPHAFNSINLSGWKAHEAVAPAEGALPAEFDTANFGAGLLPQVDEKDKEILK